MDELDIALTNFESAWEVYEQSSKEIEQTSLADVV